MLNEFKRKDWGEEKICSGGGGVGEGNFDAARSLGRFMLCCSRSLGSHRTELFTFCLLRKTKERRPTGGIPT